LRAYIDTSILTGAYCVEPNSGRAQRALQNCEPVISSLTRLEFSSSVAKKLRTKTYKPAEASLIISEFHSHIRAGIFEVAELAGPQYALANEWLDSFVTSLRTLDALHLAVAYSNRLKLVTSDVILAKAAKTLGVDVKRI